MATPPNPPAGRRISWRSRKFWLPVVGLAILLVGGYILTAQVGLG